MQISFRFWNINDTRETDGPISFAFSKYSLKERLPGIMEDIKKCNPDFLSLFEVRVDNLEMVQEALKSIGYKVTGTMAYAPNQVPDMSFYYINAYKDTSKLCHDEDVRTWFTDRSFEALTLETRKTDKTLQSCNEQFEKGTLISIFKENDTDNIIIFSSNHMPLRHAYQKKCSESLIKSLKIIGEYFEENRFKVVYIVGGDMNTLPFCCGDLKGDSSISNLITDGYTLGEHDMDKMSFFGFPYDLGIHSGEKKDLVDECYSKTKELYANGERNEELKVTIRNTFIDCNNEVNDGSLKSRLDHVLVKGCTLYGPFLKDVGDKIEGDGEYPRTHSDHLPLDGYIVL